MQGDKQTNQIGQYMREVKPGLHVTAITEFGRRGYRVSS